MTHYSWFGISFDHACSTHSKLDLTDLNAGRIINLVKRNLNIPNKVKNVVPRK